MYEEKNQPLPGIKDNILKHIVLKENSFCAFNFLSKCLSLPMVILLAFWMNW